MMNKLSLVLKVVLCASAFGGCLYAYLDEQNEVTRLRMDLPKMAKELKALDEENLRLRYEIDQFENPENLMSLTKMAEFSHLKHPLVDDIVVVPHGAPLVVSTEDKSRGMDHVIFASGMGPKIK